MEQMKDHLRKRAQSKWGSSCQILNQIIDIEGEHLKGKECVLIGMTFKDLKLRGSVSILVSHCFDWTNENE